MFVGQPWDLAPPGSPGSSPWPPPNRTYSIHLIRIIVCVYVTTDRNPKLPSIHTRLKSRLWEDPFRTLILLSFLTHLDDQIIVLLEEPVVIKSHAYRLCHTILQTVKIIFHHDPIFPNKVLCTWSKNMAPKCCASTTMFNCGTCIFSVEGLSIHQSNNHVLMRPKDKPEA